MLTASTAASAEWQEVTQESRVLEPHIQRTAVFLDAGRWYGDNWSLLLLRQVKSISSFTMTYPFSSGNETSTWSPFAPTPVTHTHTESFFQTWNKRVRLEWFLGNWYSLPAIHLISPATSWRVLLALHTLSGYLPIMCTNSMCITQGYADWRVCRSLQFLGSEHLLTVHSTDDFDLCLLILKPRGRRHDTICCG